MEIKLTEILCETGNSLVLGTLSSKLVVLV